MKIRKVAALFLISYEKTDLKTYVVVVQYAQRAVPGQEEAFNETYYKNGTQTDR